MVIEVPHRARVDPAPHGLERVDDLHGPHLGGAGHGSRRKACAHDVHGLHVAAEPTAHVRDQVHDLRVALDAHVFVRFDRAELGHAADVVAAEVDEHHVFRTFLFVGAQFLFELTVLVGVPAARPGARDRAHFDLAIGAPHQHFR
jgi:hypothetical protein